jgi:chromosome segregation ATPase
LTPERREKLHAIGTRLLDGLTTEETHAPTLEEGVDKAQKQLHGLSRELLDAHARISELDSELSHLKAEAGHTAPAQAPDSAQAPAAAPSLSAASAAQVGEILALLEDQVIGFEQRLAGFDAALAATREHAGALERRVAEAHGEAARLREESESLRREGERRERELESTTSALESALVDLAELQSGSGANRGLASS